MSRYTGPSWKQARRLGFSLTGTGKKLARRNYVPGQQGPNNRSKLSEFGRPAFVSFNDKKLEGSLIRLPERDEINEALVVEFYNKML
ncbi:hypothetical protein [Streptococcus vestibularis]|uniref:hypothetical protein n=1 Tax=Streptococcus vestibularis TaxID=1343 RepID=UPI001D0A968C|nr:hypothetical protein [Streptococcus vestibularis]MCB8557271.1 hypothetical protein [Streptococcus vestibularis]MCB8587741.1 hypothetical protein [Streptococcus vestibularis]MDU5663723.1 hypothetical protein [Streptococcus vestibularis]